VTFFETTGGLTRATTLRNEMTANPGIAYTLNLLRAHMEEHWCYLAEDGTAMECAAIASPSFAASVTYIST